MITCQTPPTLPLHKSTLYLRSSGSGLAADAGDAPSVPSARPLIASARPRAPLRADSCSGRKVHSCTCTRTMRSCQSLIDTGIVVWRRSPGMACALLTCMPTMRSCQSLCIDTSVVVWHTSPGMACGLLTCMHSMRSCQSLWINTSVVFWHRSPGTACGCSLPLRSLRAVGSEEGTSHLELFFVEGGLLALQALLDC